MCSLCICPAIPISNRPPAAMCGQHAPVHPAATPRFESRRCDLCHSQGEDKPGSPAISKWQLRLGWGLKPYRGGAGTAGGAGAKSVSLFARSPSRGPGVPPGESLVTFFSKRKSPGCRAWQSHALAERLHIRGGRGHQPLQNLFGEEGRSACWWVQGLAAPHKFPGRGAERPLWGV